MIKFINDNLRYPDDALANKVEGTVKIEFVVDGQGKIVETKILKGLGYGCDEEATRLVKLLVFEKVYNRGLNTRTKRSLNIAFKLPIKRGTQLKYQLVSNQPKTEKTPKKPTKTYQINITLPNKK